VKRYLTVIFVGLALSTLISCGRLNLTPAIKVQEDYDHLRLEHLEYWTALIEEFHVKQGYYPLQNSDDDKMGIIHVQILPPDSEHLLIDWGDDFRELTPDILLKEIERGLHRDLKYKFPPEDTPPDYAYAYNYFVNKNGYLVWVACQSCGITEISTYTMDGKSATVNIGSEGMVQNVTKAKTRSDMLSHPLYKKWRAIDIHDKNRVRRLRDRYK